MSDVLKAIIFVVAVLVYICIPTKSHAAPFLKMSYTLSTPAKTQCLSGIVYTITKDAPPKPLFYTNGTIVRC